jgi:transposase-like protein
MSREEKRAFSRAYKLRVVKRMEAGESSSALSAELDVKRTLLYRWRDTVRREGEQAFARKAGRPTKRELLQRKYGPGEETELAEARRKIAELERKIGQQQVDLDFFKQALRHVEAPRRRNSARGATASSPASRR